ncbi:MAG: hypothetical protein LBD51_05300 [Bifidobacteriaceae bacterium]|nr:hypothetical protein [Bifidobacteriaceae bacterium]
MSASARLGFRLARAGGAARLWPLAGGTAIATGLLLAAAALPGAGWPPGSEWSATAGQQATEMLVFAVPAVLLLMTAGRLASDARDARLAALRRLGLPRRRVRLVAAFENGWAALGGAAAGTAAFAVLAQVVGRAVELPGPLEPPLWAWLSAPLAVVAAAMAVGTAPTWGRDLPGGEPYPSLRWRLHTLLRARPKAAWLTRPLPFNPARPGARSTGPDDGADAAAGAGAGADAAAGGSADADAAAGAGGGAGAGDRFGMAGRRPGYRLSAARLAVLAVGLALLAIGAWPGRPYLDVAGYLRYASAMLAVFVAGAAITAVGIIAATPLVTAWIAGLLARSRRPGLLLAGRSLQVRGLGAGRVAAGLGLAVFLTVVIGLASSAWAANTGSGAVVRAYGSGPQVIEVYSQFGVGIGPAQRAEALAIPGVRGVLPQTRPGRWPSSRPGAVDFYVAVGTCAQLALALAADGCDDSRAAVIERAAPGPRWFDAAGKRLVVATWSGGRDGPAAEVTLADQPIVVSDASSLAPDYTAAIMVFVPAGLLPEDLAEVAEWVGLVAEAGSAVQERVAAWGAEHRYLVVHVEAEQYRQAQFARLSSATLMAAVLGVALLAMALNSADRVRERRRAVARQLMVGLPRRLLLAGGAIETALPALVASALGLGAGLLAMAATRGFADGGLRAGAGFWACVGGIVAAGVALATLASLPLAATKLSPRRLPRRA